MFFFESGDSEVFKTDILSCLQVMTSKLTIILQCLTCFTQTWLSVVCTCHCRGVFKNIFWYGCCSLLIFVAKKAIKGTELQFLCTQGTLLGGRVEDHRMMFTRHLHLVESMIQWFMENLHTELRVLGCKGLKTSYNHICRVLLECMIHTFKQHSTYMIIWCL